MRWAVGYSLRPGSSVVEAEVRIFNRTPLPQSMLCFANVAVHVNEDYQVIFPPRTQYVTFHGKREFTTWPIARGRYAGTDYGDGTDVSYFKNHQNRHLDVCLERHRRLLRRLRPRQAGRHDERGRPPLRARQEALDLGQRPSRAHVGQDSHRCRRPLHRAHGRRVFRQPARLLVDRALRDPRVLRCTGTPSATSAA